MDSTAPLTCEALPGSQLLRSGYTLNPTDRVEWRAKRYARSFANLHNIFLGLITRHNPRFERLFMPMRSRPEMAGQAMEDLTEPAGEVFKGTSDLAQS